MKKFLTIIFIFSFFPGFIFAATFDRYLYFGLRNDSDVTKLQEFLRDQGIYSGPITGNFFSLTQEGVKKFQEKENISPASGYFGSKTRARANAIFGSKPQTKEDQISLLTLQIQILQAKLKLLQEKLTVEQAAAPAAVATTTADTIPPVFTKSPKVSQSGFVSNPPLGAHYPYRVVFDWAVDENGFIEESTECTPVLKVAKPAGRSTEYFPEPHTSYSCLVTVKDQAGNKTTGTVSFTSPNWINIYGSKTLDFPAIVTTVLKIGEFTVYNGTTSDVLFTNFDVDIIDIGNLQFSA